MKRLFLIFAMLCATSLMASEEEIVLFDKVKDGARIQLVTSSHPYRVYYILFTTDAAKGKPLLIDTYWAPPLLDTEDDPNFDREGILDFCIFDNTLWILGFSSGRVYFKEYPLQTNLRIQNREKVAVGSFEAITPNSRGWDTYRVASTTAHGTYYFSLFADPRYGGVITNKLLVLRDWQVKEVKFTTTNIVKSVAITDSSSSWYEEITEKPAKQRTVEENTRYKLLSAYYNQPFAYFPMSANDSTYAKNEEFLIENGLEVYPQITLNNAGSIQPSLEQVEVYLKELLVRLLLIKPSDSVFIDSYIVDPNQQKLLYFFIEVNGKKVPIVRYKLETNEWLIEACDEISLPPSKEQQHQ